MPRARRRRSHAAGRRARASRVMTSVLVAVVLALAVGSLIEIHAQSAQFRAATDAGYGAMASKLVAASNQTGSRLASLMDGAPQLANSPVPFGARDPAPFRARAILQQGLDEAVSSTSAEARRAAALAPPPPTTNVGPALTTVLSDRAVAALALRSNIDQMLGMSPLPVAGAPQSAKPPLPSLRISAEQAATGMTAAGILFQHADDEYRSLQARIRADHLPIRLPRSVWAPAPVADAPLGPARLGATAGALDAAGAFVAYHQLIISAVGREPAPVASGGPQTSIPGCVAPQSQTAAAPMVMPPTGSVAATVTVTNCGTVVEPAVQLTETLALADPPGTAPPPAAATGGTARAEASLRAGSSVALSLEPLTVASGHSYTLAISIALPVGQQADNTAGSTQELLLQISG